MSDICLVKSYQIPDFAMRNTRPFDGASKDDSEPVHNMTLQQLETLASKQQDQIRAQAQLLLAKENRLTLLRKQQDEGYAVRNGQRQLPGDQGKLMTLRQKIEQQEMKLRRLRMLRGQMDNTKANNVALTSDLESIRILFNEKEKELSLAVSRVDELTNQLEDLRLLRRQRQSDKMGREETRHSAHALQLEALRRELMYRQQVTSSQASRVAHQRLLLSQRQEEMNRVDRRIAELQQRLHRRRLANDGLAQQLGQAKAKAAKVSVVEPFRDDSQEFTGNKGDPKYQTLPYGTKFSKVAPVPPPKPPPSVSNVIMATPRAYTSVYASEEARYDSDDHARPYLPPKPPSKTPESVEEAVSILKSKSEDLIKFDDPKSTLVETTTGARNTLSVHPMPQEESKVSFPTSVHISINRRIEMPPEAMFPENASPPSDLVRHQDTNNNKDVTDEASKKFPDEFFVDQEGNLQVNEERAKSSLKKDGGKLQRRVSFDPLALLLDAALEGEVELVKKCAVQAPEAANASNDEGITALHNAVCAGHFEIVKFLVEFGCDVNAQDSDGWTPLHCAASCNNLAMVQYLVEKGACVFATTVSDAETAAQKCEEDEDGYDSCSEYLYNVQEKLGIWNSGVVYGLYHFEGVRGDELEFKDGDRIEVVRKGDEVEREWWWSKLGEKEGYVPRNLLGLCPRVTPFSAKKDNESESLPSNPTDDQNRGQR